MTNLTLLEKQTVDEARKTILNIYVRAANKMFPIGSIVKFTDGEHTSKCKIVKNIPLIPVSSAGKFACTVVVKELDSLGRANGKAQGWGSGIFWKYHKRI